MNWLMTCSSYCSNSTRLSDSSPVPASSDSIPTPCPRTRLWTKAAMSWTLCAGPVSAQVAREGYVQAFKSTKYAAGFQTMHPLAEGGLLRSRVFCFVPVQ